MKKLFFSISVILLSTLNIKAQNIDSLKQVLIIAKKDITNSKIYSILLSYARADPDSALPYIQVVYQLSKEIKYDYGIRHSLGTMSEKMQTLNNYKQALYYDSMALDLHVKAKDTLGIGFMLTSIGNIYSQLHDPKNSLLFYHKALDIMTAYSNALEVIDIFYAGISGIYEQNNQLDSSLYYAKKSLPVRYGLWLCVAKNGHCICQVRQ